MMDFSFWVTKMEELCMKEKNDIYFVNGSWHYDQKTVNFTNFTIIYEQIGGIDNKEDAQIAKEIADRKYVLDIKKAKKLANAEYTFKEYCTYWLDNIFLQRTETSTKAIGIWAVNNLIIPNIQQDIILSYITADYINEIIKSCIPICDSAGTASLKYIRSILYDAYISGLIFKDVRNDLIKIPRKIPKIKLLNKEQLKKMLLAASKHPGYYFEILLALFAGLRSGEIRGLKYTDFDLENGTVRIARQYTSNYTLADSNDHYNYTHTMEEKAPKMESYRLLRIPSFLFEELENKKKFNMEIINKAQEKGVYKLDSDYISISSFGTLKNKNTLLCSLKRVCREAGVPAISMHTLRHQFATLLIEQDVPLEHISKLLGHKSTLTTFNIYCGVMDADEDVKATTDNMIPYVKAGDRVEYY